jgi:hypothetical protein
MFRREVAMSEDLLPLLDDGGCTITGTCMQRPHEAWGRCPQTGKCGTCLAWSPREENGYGRNSGQCMLDRDSRVYLDCNAQVCPYYRPRPETHAFEEFKKAPPPTSQKARRSRKRGLDREAPPPSPEALAAAAFAEQPHAVADAGAQVLGAELSARAPLPVLLERFRGGHVEYEGPGGEKRQTSVEAVYARIALLRRSISNLEDAIEASGLTDDERAKINKDLAGIGGSLTTFNFLFKDKSDQFKGQGKG